MSIFLLLALIMVCSLTAFAALAVSSAPEGYQDENGFHYGKPPKR